MTTATRSGTATPPATSPPRARQRLRRPRESRGHLPRRGPCPPDDDHRRRRALDLEHRRRQVPEATQIVDLYHARQHLCDLVRLLDFMLGDRKDEWLAARMEDLDYGHIDGICQAARVFPLEGIKKDEPGTALGYFENNAPRMRYHWFRQCGLFTGSGVVEARLQVGHRPAPQAVRHALDHRRRRRHHRPALPRGQQHLGSHLQHAPHSDANRLTRPNRQDDLGYLQK